MKPRLFLNRNFFYFISLLSLVCSLMSGCIRLTGTAGLWKQDAEDEQPVSHLVGFDTNNLLPPPPDNPDVTKANGA